MRVYSGQFNECRSRQTAANVKVTLRSLKFRKLPPSQNVTQHMTPPLLQLKIIIEWLLMVSFWGKFVRCQPNSRKKVASSLTWLQPWCHVFLWWTYSVDWKL